MGEEEGREDRQIIVGSEADPSTVHIHKLEQINTHS